DVCSSDLVPPKGQVFGVGQPRRPGQPVEVDGQDGGDQQGEGRVAHVVQDPALFQAGHLLRLFHWYHLMSKLFPLPSSIPQKCKKYSHLLAKSTRIPPGPQKPPAAGCQNRPDRTTCAYGRDTDREIWRWECARPQGRVRRSEEHTSELQSRFDLVCR